MKFTSGAFAAAFTCAALFISAPAYASPGLQQIFKASMKAETAVNSCAQRLEGKAFIDCVAQAMSRYNSNLADPLAIKVAPQGAPTAATASSGVKAAATPAAAASVLRNAQSAVAALAASSEKETKTAYNRISAAFARAAATVGTKG